MIKNERPIEYQMTQKMFDALLEQRTEAEKKENPYSYVMDIINREYGLRGTVKHILISNE